MPDPADPSRTTTPGIPPANPAGSADPAKPATPPKPAKLATPARPRRTRRFVLPEEHHDEDGRTAERIVAFVHGPGAKPRPATLAEASASRARLRRPFALDTRLDWTAALHHEGARHARYGRPASVLLIELTSDAMGPELDRVARSVADLIRVEARETDRAMRRGVASFRVLLPETGARAARAAAERLDRAFGEADIGRTDGVTVRIDVATASRSGSLEDVLSDAEDKLAARTARRPATTTG